jgi:Citrate synthase, C-terminal domain
MPPPTPHASSPRAGRRWSRPRLARIVHLRHSGAPDPTLDMLDEIEASGDIDGWIERKLATGERLLGLGHRATRVFAIGRCAGCLAHKERRVDPAILRLYRPGAAFQPPWPPVWHSRAVLRMPGRFPPPPGSPPPSREQLHYWITIALLDQTRPEGMVEA